MISIVVAMDQNRVIGKENKLPWHLPADLAHFKSLTMGHVIVMGRKTYESIGRPLPGRTNVILTKNPDYQAEGCVVLHSVEEVLSRFSEDPIDVIGGTQIITLFLPLADTLYLTLIKASFPGDTYLPTIDMSEWELISKRKGVKDAKNPYDYYFLTYKKRLRQ
ncbi:dihydrofolate reductase [Aneurinibacillus thermoaerophilus]|uniref:dihydrofolate reductase n=1 Tax=Aneurinibacillus thermoaerophilus TaxID=143495 RepID=UPI002E2186C6|nr:dihydrofolate reductase [Aneurinibacillus thermoaerophilus]MED0735604.1 dihydrofolate reductase [Aneurinibacillus thermoaerophilus]MED0763708.1 dihydrofolate reductase [Aneurinibacillus thermoaerophilus]